MELFLIVHKFIFERTENFIQQTFSDFFFQIYFLLEFFHVQCGNWLKSHSFKMNISNDFTFLTVSPLFGLQVLRRAKQVL